MEAFYIVLGALLSLGGGFLMEVYKDKRDTSRRKKERSRDALVRVESLLASYMIDFAELSAGYARLTEADLPAFGESLNALVVAQTPLAIAARRLSDEKLADEITELAIDSFCLIYETMTGCEVQDVEVLERSEDLFDQLNVLIRESS